MKLKQMMFYDPSSMNEIGKMNDESKGKANDEFAGLKSKMRFLTNVDGKKNKTGKRVNKHQRRIQEGGVQGRPFFLKSLVFFCNHFEELQTVLF